MKDIVQEAKILLSDTGMDIYLPKFAILWYLVMEDFKIEREWLDAIDCLEGDRSQKRWENFFEYDIELIEFSFDSLTEGLKMGYLPGDRIAVVVSQPSYSEDDIDFDFEVIKVVSGKIEPRKLEGLINKVLIKRIEKKRKIQARFDKAHTDIDKMYLVQKWYFAPDQSLWNEMEMPRGFSLALKSRHLYPMHSLAFASSDSGDRKKTSQEILAKIKKELPHVAPLYEKLPIRSW